MNDGRGGRRAKDLLDIACRMSDRWLKRWLGVREPTPETVSRVVNILENEGFVSLVGDDGWALWHENGPEAVVAKILSEGAEIARWEVL